MDLRNCRGCGRMIQYPGFGMQLCGQCNKKLEEKFQEVKKYIKENPNVTINQLSEETEVTVQQITQWIREERLLFSKDSPIGIDCEGCGRMIKTGRYCAECKNKMIDQLGGPKKKAIMNNSNSRLKDAKGKMRFIDRQDK